MVAAAVFTITLKDDEAVQKFLDALAPELQHVLHNEPGTLTYELHQVVEEGKPVPYKYIMFERYSSMHALQQIHLQSKPFKALFKSLDDIAVVEHQLTIGENTLVQPLLDSKPQVWSESSVEEPLLKKGVLVFGGARHGRHPAYSTEARALAKYIAEEAKVPLVYGGGTVGVMGELAKEAHALNAKIISVIPSALSEREVSGTMIGDMIYTTSTMSERKSIMFAHANTVVALPGGVGTFDELLEVITLHQLNAYRPKIGIVNVDGFFDPFVALLKHLIDQEFVEANIFDFLVIKPTAVAVMEALQSFTSTYRPAFSLTWSSRP